MEVEPLLLSEDWNDLGGACAAREETAPAPPAGEPHFHDRSFRPHEMRRVDAGIAAG